MSPFTHGLRWGAITAGALILLGVIFNLTGAYAIPGAGLLFYGLLFGLMWLAMRKFTAANGSRSYGQGLVIAIPLVLVAALLYSAFFFGWISFVSDAPLEFGRSTAEEAIAAQNPPQEQMDQQMKMMDTMFSAPVFTLMTLVGLTIVGGIGGLLISLIGRKEAAAAA